MLILLRGIIRMTRIVRLLCVLLLFCFGTMTYAFDDQTRVAFYYGDNPPLDELHAWNVVVVHPGAHIEPKQYNNPSSQLYAYVSVGELDASDVYSKQTDASWRVGKNLAWDSRVMDLANPAWRDFLLNQVITPLWQEGYRGFFLDTLDSWQLLQLSAEKNQQQQDGIVDLIKKIKAKYPDASIITNRGFEVLDKVHQDIDAVAAESLFSGWDNRTKRYTTVPNSERQWLLAQLNKAHQAWKLPIIVIDYMPPNQADKARDVAKKISSLGFIPWVSGPYLDTLGISTIEVIPRKILLLYNEKPRDNDLSAIAVYGATAFVLQYMGYIPILHFVDDSLPKGNLAGCYAGIITWFNTPVIKNHALLEKWLTQQIKQHIPVVFMQNFGLPLTSTLLKQLHIDFPKDKGLAKNVIISYQDKRLTGYELLPKPNPIDFQPITANGGKVLISLESANQQFEDVVAIMPWGGYALDPFHMVSLPDSHSLWVINPFEFLRQALQLPLMPVPDITTVSGRRVLLAQIDGDAFISRVPWKGDKYAGEVILEDILEQYKIPTTVSIVQKEFDILKTNPNLQQRLIKVAKQTFALPWIELATHTYSHPLQWGKLIEGETNTPYLSYPDKSYLLDYHKEIVGSADYINRYLAPEGKKVKAILWSGDANAQEKPLSVAYDAGLKNINGMAKIYDNANHSISDLGAFGAYRGNYFQVYSPVSNEFEYTDHWSQPLYAFAKVINTFTLTETPHRYKPVSIYYHFYSAVDQASLRGLKRVYDWAMQQHLIPLMVSDYIDNVLDFNHTVIARIDKDTWLITNNNHLREFRLPDSVGVAELQNSKNIAGFNHANHDLYVHLGPAVQSILRFTDTAVTKPYLVDANANITQWKVTNDQTIGFALQGYMPLVFNLANMQDCQLYHKTQLVSAANNGTYTLEGMTHGTFEIRCNK